MPRRWAPSCGDDIPGSVPDGGQSWCPLCHHPSSWQGCSGPALPRRGMPRARGTPALPRHPPAARDGHTDGAKAARPERLARGWRLSNRGKGAGLVQSQVKHRESSPSHFSRLFAPCVCPCTEDVATKIDFFSFNDAQLVTPDSCRSPLHPDAQPARQGSPEASPQPSQV